MTNEEDLNAEIRMLVLHSSCSYYFVERLTIFNY